MDLYIVRHAIAFDQDPEQWPDDRGRPLTEKGTERFQQAARGLATIVPTVDLLLSSTLTRAWQTATILHEEAGWPEPQRFEAVEPGTAPAEIRLALELHSSVDTLAIVGHEPNLSDFAAYLLCGEDRDIGLGFKKGGAACVRFPSAVAPGAGELRWWLTPKILRRLATTPP